MSFMQVSWQFLRIWYLLIGGTDGLRAVGDGESLDALIQPERRRSGAPAWRCRARRSWPTGGTAPPAVAGCCAGSSPASPEQQGKDLTPRTLPIPSQPHVLLRLSRHEGRCR